MSVKGNDNVFLQRFPGLNIHADTQQVYRTCATSNKINQALPYAQIENIIVNKAGLDSLFLAKRPALTSIRQMPNVEHALAIFVYCNMFKFQIAYLLYIHTSILHTH